jgi:hypothetical protein
MGLVQKAAIFEIGHDVTYGRRTERINVPARHAARRDRLARFNVFAHYV